MAASIFRPTGTFKLKDASDEFDNNIQLVNEASESHRMDAADLLIKMEIARNLDRIATALEKRV